MSNTPLWFRRLLVGGVSTLTAGGLGLAGLLSAAGPANATSSFAITQIAGTNRFGTAAAIAMKAFPSGAGTVIVASGVDTNLPDSLAASYLAGVDKAPILLTNPTGVPPETAAALAALKPTKIIVVGGTGAVSASTYTSLGGTQRISGADRFATQEAIDAASATVGSKKTAIVADGADTHLVDSLGSSPLAVSGPYPLFLINGAAGTLSAADLATMKTDGITNVVIVGGSAAVGPQIATQLTAAGITMTAQEAGPDRSATSDALAEYEIANYGFSTTAFDIASGAQAHLADSLSGGPLGGMQTPPLPTLITDSVDQAASVVTFAAAHAATEASANLFGGSAAVDATAEAAIVAAAQSKGAGAVTSLPTLLSATANTVTTANATSASPAGTTVKYVFSSSLAGVVPVAAGFHLYDANGMKDNATATTAVVDPTNSNAVDVLFPTLLTTTSTANITLATVGGTGDAGGAAVTTAAGANPDGSAGIGTSSSGGVTKGVTTAPDLTTASATRAATTLGLTAVDVNFNKNAFVVNPADFAVILANGTPELCTAPAAGSTTASGGGDVGGNGTMTLTLLCPETTPGTILTTTSIARVVDAAGAVSTAATGGVTNQIEATSTPNSAVVNQPDLASVAIVLGANAGANDTLVYTFNGPVTAPLAANLLALNSDSTTSTPTSAAINSANANQVVATYPVGGLSKAVGGIANVSAVTGLVLANELGVTNSSTSSTTSGTVAAPQLSGFASTPFTNGAGVSVPGATYTFTQGVTAAPAGAAPAGLHAYDADGTELTCATIGIVNAGGTTVMCQSFVAGSMNTGTAATTTQVSGIVLGTADFGAVTGEAAPNANANPEGAAAG